MAQLSDAEKALLRATGHKAEFALFVHKPASMLVARLNDAAITRGERSIDYDGGTGTAANFAIIAANPGMPLWVSDATNGEAGAKEVGVVRVRSIVGDETSGTITVAENAIDWSDNDYLTIKFDFPLFPVWPYLTTDTSTWRKDGPEGDLYSDENEEPPPVVIMGPHRAGALTAGSLALSLDCSDSYGIGLNTTISSQAWVFYGTGTFDDDTSDTPTLTITAANPDGDWLKCTVTDSNGKTQASYRLIFTTDANNEAYTDFEVSGLSGNWQSGGWRLSMEVHGDAALSDFPDNAIVLLWHIAIYGSTTQYIGGPTGAKGVLFAGYLRSDTLQQDWNTGSVSFDATTIQALLNKHMMFSVALEAHRDPDVWYKYLYNALSAARAVHHLWRYQSTLFEIADVFLPTSNTLLMKACDDFIRQTLYAQANTFAEQHGIQAHVACNKQGQLYIEENANYLDSTDRDALTTITELTSEDWTVLTIVRQIEKQVAMVNLSGFGFDGVTATPLVAKAPGDVPEDEGLQSISTTRQILDDQTQANELAGRVLAVANNEYPEVRVPFHGHYGGVTDLVPQEWYTITIGAGDTPRDLVWTDKKMVCRSSTIKIDAANGFISADAVMETEAEGPDGITGDYPTDVPDDVTPPAPTWPPDPATSMLTGALLSFGYDGCWYRPPESTDWAERDTGVVADNDEQGGWDPWWFTPTKQNSSDPNDSILWRCQVGKIYRSTNGGQTWLDVTPTNDPPNDLGDTTAPTAATVTYLQRVDSIHADKLHIFLVGFQEVDSGDSLWRGWLLRTDDDGATYTWQSLSGAQASPPGYVAGQDYTFNFLLRNSTLGWTVYNDPECDDATFENCTSPCGNGNQWFQDDWVQVGGDREKRINLQYPAKFTFTASTVTMRRPAKALLAEHGRYYLYSSDDYDSGYSTVGSASVTGTGAYVCDNISLGNNVTDKYIRIKHYTYGQLTTPDNAMMVSIWFEALTLDTSGILGVGARPIRADLDTEDGTTLLVTCWYNDGLYLQEYATSDLSLTKTTSLGNCTLAELNAWTYVAWPVCALYDKAKYYIFGRMTSPTTLSGTQHVIVTGDGATTWASIENGWGANACTAMLVNATQIKAIRDADAGNPARLYVGNDAGLTFKSNLSFGNNVGVLPDAFTESGEGDLAAGADTAQATLIIGSESPYSAWSDLTGAHAVASNIRSLTYL